MEYMDQFLEEVQTPERKARSISNELNLFKINLYDENLNNKKIDKLTSYMERLFDNKEYSLSRVQELLSSIYKGIGAEKTQQKKNDVVDKYIDIYRKALQENLAKNTEDMHAGPSSSIDAVTPPKSRKTKGKKTIKN